MKFSWKTGLFLVVGGLVVAYLWAVSDPQRWYGTKCKILWRDAGMNAPFAYKPKWEKVGDVQYIIRVYMEDSMGFPIEPGVCEFNSETKSMTLFKPPA